MFISLPFSFNEPVRAVLTEAASYSQTITY